MFEIYIVFLYICILFLMVISEYIYFEGSFVYPRSVRGRVECECKNGCLRLTRTVWSDWGIGQVLTHIVGHARFVKEEQEELCVRSYINGGGELDTWLVWGKHVTGKTSAAFSRAGAVNFFPFVWVILYCESDTQYVLVNLQSWSSTPPPNWTFSTFPEFTILRVSCA